MEKINIDINYSSDKTPIKNMKELSRDMAEASQKAEEAKATVEAMNEQVSRNTTEIKTLSDSIVSPDEEDITSVDKIIKFADKDYIPEVYSGLGRVYLRKNLVSGELTEVLNEDGITFEDGVWGKQIPISTVFGTVAVNVFLSVNGEEVKEGYVISLTKYKDGSTVKSVGVGIFGRKITTDDKDAALRGWFNTSYIPFVIADDYDTIILRVEKSEGQMSESDIVVFSVKTKGIGSNILTQNMINKPNTIYHIQYDYDLEGETITIPAGCTLLFMGGSFKNGTLVGNNTKVFSLAPTSPFDNVTVSGLIMLSDAAFTGSYNDLSDKPDIYVKPAIDDLLSDLLSDVNTQLGGKASTTALESLGTSVQRLSENTYSKHESDIKFATNEELSKATTLNKTFDISNIDYARIATGWKIAVSADDNNLIWENTNSENPADVDCYILVPKNLFGDLGIQLNPFINGAKVEEDAALSVTFYPFKDGELIGSSGSDIVGFSIFYKDIATQASTFFTNNVQPWLRRTDFNQIGILITNTDSSNLVFTAGDSVSLVIKTKGQAAAKGYGYEITYDDLLKYNKEGNFTMVTSDNRNYVVGVRDNTTGVMSYPIGNSQKPSGTSLTQSEFEALNTAMATGMKTLVIIPITGDTMLDTSAKLNIYNTINN